MNDAERAIQELWEETEHSCVIPRNFQRYHVEVSLVHGSDPGSAHARWWRETRYPKPHYEAEVWRGVGRTSLGLIVCACGYQCAGPGWDNVFGRTPAEAVSKARKEAMEWVRWQLSLPGRRA